MSAPKPGQAEDVGVQQLRRAGGLAVRPEEHAVLDAPEGVGAGVDGAHDDVRVHLDGAHALRERPDDELRESGELIGVSVALWRACPALFQEPAHEGAVRPGWQSDG